MFDYINCFQKILNSFYIHKFGFKQKKCFCDAISSVTEYVYQASNQENFVVSLFIDLKKTYDAVNHEILFGKRYCYGIRAVVLKWLRYY